MPLYILPQISCIYIFTSSYQRLFVKYSINYLKFNDICNMVQHKNMANRLIISVFMID
jgi:hypothetical protein